MKNQLRFLPFVLVGALLLAAFPGLSLRGGAMAQAPPPNEEWRQIFTPHFVVTFPQGLDDLAERAAVRAERAYDQLAGRFVGAPPGRVQLLLADHADISNGFARPVPFNQITIFARPPTDGSLAYYDDWLELVITHELVHTFHLDMAGTPGKVIRSVFGRIPSSWPVFPSAAAPTWLIEGIATYFESSLTGAGRTKGTWQEMVLRAAALEGELASADRVSGSSPVWPAGNRPYVYGARYFEYLASIHGEEAIGSFARSVAGLWVPYRMNAAAREAFGAPVSSSWDAWRRQVTSHYRQVAETLSAHAPVTEGEAVDGPGRAASAAVVSRDGRTLAFVRSDGVDKSQIRLSDPDGSNSRLLTRINGPGGSLGWGPGGSLVFSQLDFVGRYYLASDLYMVSPEGSVERLTRGQRLAHPDLSPDGERIVAVQEGGGTSVLAVLELATGAVNAVSEPHPDEHWAYPRWSPDGRHIAAVRWRKPAMADIVVLRADGTLAVEVTGDRAVDTTPFWTPDGRFLLWSSDRTGIPNVFAAPFVPDEGLASRPGGDARVGQVSQVTNMLGGATHPTVDPGAEWIYFSSYHADGWTAERIPFDPETWFDPLPASPRFVPEAPAPEAEAIPEGVLAAPPSPAAAAPSPEPEPAPPVQLDPPRSYRALPTLRPHYWIPVAERAERGLDQAGGWRDVIRPAFGVRTEGSDLVGRHAYAASARLSLDGKFSGGVGYAYRGLGNPDLGLSLSQAHSASSRTIGGGKLRSGEAVREYFLLERERRANLSVSFRRRRYRTAASITLNGGVVQEQQTLQQLPGSTGARLRLRRPESTQTEMGATLSFSNAQQRAFSFSREDGVSFFGLGRWRHDTGLDAAARGVTGEDLGYTEFLGEASAYKAIAGPGFANHVLAARVSAGVAFGPGADRFLFDAGGAEGRAEAISGFGLFGGSSLFFPLRGYPENFRSGRKAWTASAEYRFPLLLADRGLGSLPLFLDRLHGSVFFDAGNAWGPVGDNPRQPVLASAGIELSAIVVPFYVGGLTLRGGAGFPMRGPSDPVFYLRAGNAF